ncbi:hypothetical protein J7T55_013570 [Diaporthe amygdali]|uniref:uncharacterized protein n=1 Tax=Phomopsis amygdali TaxID=1214568 RepID=UPI0022FE2898|nr:uncharacterized protein J7T55_013570 [Diaporthe amygdali]KAJ0119332.1 hypothetical protein J7T55_013570 [Diaporthe amygdali]
MLRNASSRVTERRTLNVAREAGLGFTLHRVELLLAVALGVMTDERVSSSCDDAANGQVSGLSVSFANRAIHVDAGNYGVGIRIAFYLQWFGMIITSWLFESDAINLHFINAVTTAAMSIGLVLNLERLQPVEIYIVLLLACGTLYFTVPIYLWRLVTSCRPWWDPDRWTRIKTGWLFRVLTYSIITKNRILSLQHFRTICDLIVASIVTLAIELVISWNKITVANDLNSSAQIIPPALTGAYLLRCVCVWITGPDGNGGDNNIQNRSLPPRKRNLSDRQRRSSYRRRRRSRRTSRTSADFMDAYPDLFGLSELTVPTPLASFGGFSAPPASGYYGMPSNYYYAYYGDYVGDEVPPLDDNLGHISPEPPPPPAPTPASSHGRNQDSPVGGEGYMRL